MIQVEWWMGEMLLRAFGDALCILLDFLDHNKNTLKESMCDVVMRRRQGAPVVALHCVFLVESVICPGSSTVKQRMCVCLCVCACVWYCSLVCGSPV
jgi:hypothetical protein